MIFYLRGLGLATIVFTFALLIAGSIMPTEVPCVFAMELVLALTVVLLGGFVTCCTSNQCHDRFYRLLGINLHLVAIGSFYIGNFISENDEVSLMYGALGSFFFILGTLVIFVPRGRPSQWTSSIQLLAGGITICAGSVLFSLNIEVIVTHDIMYTKSIVPQSTALSILIAGLCLLKNGFLLSYIEMQRSSDNDEHPEVTFLGIHNNIFVELIK